MPRQGQTEGEILVYFLTRFFYIHLFPSSLMEFFASTIPKSPVTPSGILIVPYNPKTFAYDFLLSI